MAEIEIMNKGHCYNRPGFSIHVCEVFKEEYVIFKRLKISSEGFKTNVIVAGLVADNHQNLIPRKYLLKAAMRKNFVSAALTQFLIRAVSLSWA